MVILKSFSHRIVASCCLVALFALPNYAQRPDPPVKALPSERESDLKSPESKSTSPNRSNQLRKLRLPQMPGAFAPAPPNDPGVRNAIEALLRGEKNVDVPEPMLEDFGRFIRGRKSVLSGSVLEQMTETHDDHPTDPPSSGTMPGRSKRAINDFRWRTAEHLLKSARMLEKLQPNDQNQIKLVNEMRRQAVSLMAKLLNPVGANTPRESVAH